MKLECHNPEEFTDIVGAKIERQILGRRGFCFILED
jgi:hypothetical protein